MTGVGGSRDLSTAIQLLADVSLSHPDMLDRVVSLAVSVASPDKYIFISFAHGPMRNRRLCLTYIHVAKTRSKSLLRSETTLTNLGLIWKGLANVDGCFHHFCILTLNYGFPFLYLNDPNVSLHTHKSPAADALPFTDDNRVHRDYSAHPSRFGPVAVRALAVGGVRAGGNCSRMACLGCSEIP